MKVINKENKRKLESVIFIYLQYSIKTNFPLPTLHESLPQNSPPLTRSLSKSTPPPPRFSFFQFQKEEEENSRNLGLHN